MSLTTFDEVLKSYYLPNAVTRIVSEHSAFFSRVKKAEIDGMYEQMADNLSAHLWGNHCGAVGKVGGTIPATISPALVLTVATLGALEFLRHRKAAVAKAEAEQDYRSLADEFWDWIALLFRRWRGEVA